MRKKRRREMRRKRKWRRRRKWRKKRRRKRRRKGKKKRKRPMVSRYEKVRSQSNVDNWDGWQISRGWEKKNYQEEYLREEYEKEKEEGKEKEKELGKEKGEGRGKRKERRRKGINKSRREKRRLMVSRNKELQRVVEVTGVECLKLGEDTSNSISYNPTPKGQMGFQDSEDVFRMRFFRFRNKVSFVSE